jgi:transketolase
MLTPEELQDLELKANTIREDIIEMLVEAGSGHSAGPLGMADIFTALYFKILNIDPQNPGMPDRDRLVLSNGHICPVLYATMANRGFFPREELKTLRKFGTRLQGHPHREALPGLETTSGPLGSGLSQSCGMALAGKLDHKDWRVYCLMSDGEHDEGNTWEAVELAAKYKLNNLVGIVDRNNIQIDGTTDDVMPLGDLGKKYEQFGWNVIYINGHDFNEIVDAYENAKNCIDKPTIIIAHTIPGKGVDFMENRFEWHGMPPDLQNVEGAPPKGEQAKKALEELRTLQGKIMSEHQ